ncbi:MAG: hypothetical protein AAGB46_13425 [Verrucomicrobiota bacterium]
MLLIVGCWAVGADEAFEDARWNEASRDFSASLGIGYKENVLYSEVLPQDSMFSYADLEGMAKGEMFNLGAEWTLMGLGEFRHYNDIDGVPDETFGLVLGEFSKSIGLFGEAGLGVQYLYVNQAFDATFDIVEERRAILKVQEPELYAKWRSLFWEFEYTVKISTSRMYFSDRTDDYETDSLEFELDYELGERDVLILTLEGLRRNYVERLARIQTGETVAGFRRKMDSISAELEWERSYKLGDWSGTIGLEGKLSERRDGFAGYYDRDRRKFGLECEFEHGGWYLSADVAYTESDYLVQVTELGDAVKTEGWVGALNIEKDLNETWAAFLQLDLDKEDSNESLFSYEANSLMLGFTFK